MNGDMKHLNRLIYFQFINFQGIKMEDHILEMFECLNWDSNKLYLRINPAWNKDEIIVFI